MTWDGFLLQALQAGVKVTEFWDLSFYELMACIRAANATLYTWYTLAAWHVSPILQSWGSDVTMNKLLGKESNPIDFAAPDAAHRLQDAGVKLNPEVPNG